MDPDILYRALAARDGRYDGRFFVGVTTTGIYCRPVCVARTPGRARCRFYRRAAEAERDGFRACFRCRPELAPGHASIDARGSLVARAVAQIEGGALVDGRLADLAVALGVTDRHLRRVLGRELGLSPVALMQSARLALARQLCLDGALPFTQVALASGFRSLRRFNAAFLARYGRSPSALRRMRRTAPTDAALRISLGYRAPYDWATQLDFLRAHAVPSVEHVDGETYFRTVEIGAARGWIRVDRSATRPAVTVELDGTLQRALLPVADRVRRVFDLDADPSAVIAHLGRDRTLGPLLARRTPRLLGAFDGFEIAARTLLGQQVSVAAARTLSARFVARFGEPIDTPWAALTHLHPRPARVASATVEALMGIGLPRRRAEGLRALARAIDKGSLRLDGTMAADDVARALGALPSVGPWTVEYVLLRALSVTDAFPEADLALRRRLDGLSGRALVARTAPWRPWRGYAAMLIWSSHDDD